MRNIVKYGRVTFKKYWHNSIPRIVKHFTAFTNIINISQYFTVFYRNISRNISCKYFEWYFKSFTWYFSIYLCKILCILCCECFTVYHTIFTIKFHINILCLFFWHFTIFYECCTPMSNTSWIMFLSPPLSHCFVRVLFRTAIALLALGWHLTEQ